MTIDCDDPLHDDDQWLYLPALRKTKRIATTDKSGRFMGSELNYADMAHRELEDYAYHFYEKGPEQVFGGVKTWAICPRSTISGIMTGFLWTSSTVFKTTGIARALDRGHGGLS